MKLRTLFLLMALMLTISTQAQIDPPQPPLYGYLRLCEFTGQVALRELPQDDATALVMLQAGDLIEPLNEVVTTSGVEYRRVRASLWDGWMRTRKTNGTELKVCLASN